MANDETTTDEKTTEQPRDEYGLVIPQYAGMVLFVVPPADYAETTMRYARSTLYNVDIGSRTVSTQDEELIHGRLQDEFQPDGVLRDAAMDKFAGVVFCGGPGALALCDDPDALRLAREAVAQDKVIAAWGHAGALLAKAGIVHNRRVTGDSSVRETLTGAGATFTGTHVEVDGKLVTGMDESSGLRFAKALTLAVRSELG